ncbi:hypothetical protein AS180_17865 [Priestia veravalensis]|uniref:Uncharacterized protein n=1 Tax=Priestia veravalensis TaxID=1414648 RepID=A0A0V8JHW9_9BACI|nr:MULTISPECIES: hypothetical protein [Priestia]KSU86556.1 hypothetical protein AS180_17865 [Priestia veravalensis]SCC50642.1 hypothetical protein GA0061087_10664 [Priestia flexa]
MVETLRKLSFKLDCQLDSIGCQAEILSDVKTLLYHLKEDMDKAVHIGEERAYYHEHHRMVRVLAELMHFTVKELNKDYEDAHCISGKLYAKITGKEGDQDNE